MTLTNALKQKARDLGFSMVGIVKAEPSRTLDAYMAWIGAEMHGKMGYMAREDRIVRRQDLNVIVPDVRYMVCVGLDYETLKLPDAIADDPARGRISNYAWGVDYHDVMTPKLKELGAWLVEQSGDEIEQKVYVDTGAILERSHAQEAGLGFVGKNTMLIGPRSGSWFFLGELLTTADLIPDKPAPTPTCGSCTRCLTACPTDAFPQPFVLDARKCISYLTIELKSAIPRELRPLLGNWIYGCDICQAVCPFNRFSHTTGADYFRPDNIDRAAPQLLALLALDDEGFKTLFANSPIKRIKRRKLVSNACVAAGNWGRETGNKSAVNSLITLLNDKEPLIRAMAVWALGQIGAGEEEIKRLGDSEIDEGVLAEIAEVRED